MSKKAVWTAEEDENLKKYVDLGDLSYKKISKLINKSGLSCWRRANELKIKNSHSVRKHYFDKSYWEIPNEENSYWAGFLGADGCLAYQGGNCQITLTIGTIDKNHLEKYRKALGYTGPIQIHKSKPNNLVKVRINSNKYWIDHLKDNFSLAPQKTYRLAPPNLDEHLSLCYLAGYTDGDGCILYNKEGGSVRIKWVSSSIEILKWIKNIIDSQYSSLVPERKVANILSINNYYVYMISSARSAQFIDDISKINLPTLDRKWRKPEVLAYVARQKEKYPHLFDLKPCNSV